MKWRDELRQKAREWIEQEREETSQAASLCGAWFNAHSLTSGRFQLARCTRVEDHKGSHEGDPDELPVLPSSSKARERLRRERAETRESIAKEMREFPKTEKERAHEAERKEKRRITMEMLKNLPPSLTDTST